MAKAANSTNLPEINRRNVVMASAALMLAGGTPAAVAADGDEELFAAIETWRSGREALAKLDKEWDATHDDLVACKASFPADLLQPLEMPHGPMRPWPDPKKEGWREADLKFYLDRGYVQDRPELCADGVMRSQRDIPISPATLDEMQRLLKLRQAFDAAVSDAQAKHDDAHSRFDDMVDVQFARMMNVVVRPARTAAGAKAKCAMLLEEPLAGTLEETDCAATIRALITDLQALAA